MTLFDTYILDTYLPGAGSTQNAEEKQWMKPIPPFLPCQHPARTGRQEANRLMIRDGRGKVERVARSHCCREEMMVAVRMDVGWGG